MEQLVLDYEQYLKNNNKSKKTISLTVCVLRQFMRSGLSVEEMTYMNLEGYFTQRHKTLAESSFQLERGLIRGFLMYCQEVRSIKMQFHYSVVKRRKVRSDVKFLTREQVALAIKKTKSLQDKLIIATLFETGMRIGEVVNLKAEDIIHDELRVTGKGGKQRVVFAPPELAYALAQHMIEKNITRGHVFQPLQDAGSGGKYAVDSVRKRVKKCFQNIGITMHPHMLRHGFGTDLYRKKVDLRAIQTLLGHSNISTTEIYTHVTSPELHETYKMAMPRSLLAAISV